MRLPPLPFAVLDTETTGFVPRVHHIAEVACVRYEQGTLAATYEQLIAIPDELPPHVQVLTRITPDMLVGKPTIAEATTSFLETLGTDTLLVGQNLAFDLGMLKGEGIDLTDRPWIDTSLLAALVFPELKSYSLQYLSNALDLPHEPQHRALGDVHATAALLGAIWERLCEMPPAKIAEAKAVMNRSSEGYRLLCNLLPAEGGDGAWLEHARAKPSTTTAPPLALPPSTPGTVTLCEEPLDPSFVPSLIAHSVHEKTPTLFAVKNLDSALKRHDIPAGVTVIHPSSHLLNPDAAHAFLAQETFTPDEATLALKLLWFAPRVRNDLSLHAGERDAWNGKLAATDDHSIFVKQHETDTHVRLLDHRQLLHMLRSGAPGTTIPHGSRIVIDDASMLEDTATKACGSMLSLDDLRAAAQGNDLLMQLADRAMLWVETLKAGTDQRMLTPADVARRETHGLIALLHDVLNNATLPPRVRYLLTELQTFLHPPTDVPMLSWIETRSQSGSVFLHAAPERIDLLLKKILFDSYATILLVPPSLSGTLPAVLPAGYPTTLHPADRSLGTFPMSFPSASLDEVLASPPPGKTIALVGSKRSIELAFINHTERLEAQGITLICQGLSGGQGRMESDFAASTGTTLWLLTPWMYEGIDLPEGSVQHLVLDSVPFDHPGQPVFSRRKDLFSNGFEQYALVRLLERLFRLLRAFSRHADTGADVCILDQRMKTKAYGTRVQAYVETFATQTAPAFTTTPIHPKTTGKHAKKKDDNPQQTLPL